jgi:hypothetical protein
LFECTFFENERKKLLPFDVLKNPNTKILWFIQKCQLWC